MRTKLNVLSDEPQFSKNGVLLYNGPSRINNKNIVVVATGIGKASANIKTGDMIQTWILNGEENPIKSLKDGQDFNVCGDCKHRVYRSCYVNVAQAPHQVYKSWLNNRYDSLKNFEKDPFENRYLRIGSYGDPYAVPVKVWETISKNTIGWTGYTHQWRKNDAKAYMQFCMASCDSVEEADIAKALGWKPFLVRSKDVPLPKGYFSCPASKEENHRLNCNQCTACRGGVYKEGKGLPSIIAHGPVWKQNFFEKNIIKK